MTEHDDIVARLRLYAQKQRETRSSVLGLLLSDSADEIERLRRDYSCICNEMRRMMEERDEARREVCAIYADTWIASRRTPMGSDIVARVRVWSDWLDDRCPDTAVRDDLREAADEIERLRTRVVELEASR